MWADNETSIDLLGFDFLVDSLEVILTDPRLLPVTVGVTGDWGSGKSSLMGMTKARLEADEYKGKFPCVAFSPWRFEDYEDIKVALMTAILDRLDTEVQANKDLKDKIGDRLSDLRMKAQSIGAIKALVTGGATLAGADPGSAALAGQAAEVAAAKEDDKQQSARAYESVAEFHAEFAEVMDSIDDEIQALVVFIDDLDRCSVETIVDTFEAVRLFLHAPGTAYVVGAHQRIIQSALDDRYPAHGEGDENLGRDYLEKMLQVMVTVPPLSEPEAETYVNLLFAELHAPEKFDELVDRAREVRNKNRLAVAMNAGIAKEVIGEPSDGLAEAFALTEQIAVPLVRGLRGNPRQIKRFLNTLLLRQRTAAKRDIDLKPAILAKLMVLETARDLAPFEQLFEWQLAADGAPAELEAGERLARGEDVEDVPEEVKNWANKKEVKDWLQLEPQLAGEVLSPYFSFSRDRLSPAAPAARLSLELQQLLARMRSETDALRGGAVDEVAALESPALQEVAGAIFDAARRDPSSSAMNAAASLASKVSDVADEFFSTLDQVQANRIPIALAPQLMTLFPGDARATATLDRWATDGPKRLQDAVQQARK
jgi:hypothetical protein